MDQLINLIGDERVSVASAEKNRYGRNEGLDKEAVKKSLEHKQKMADISKSLAEKTPEERINWVQEMKAKGDNLYKEANFSQALTTYLDTLMGLNEEVFGPKGVKDYKIKICGNMAMCAVEMKNTHKALELIRQAIAVDPDYYKSHLKEAIIYERAENFDQAV